MQNTLNFNPAQFIVCGSISWRRKFLMLGAPYQLLAGIQGGAIGHAVQPTPQRAGLADGPCFARQDQEGCLERVLRVRVIGKHAAANVQNHRPVTAQHRMKRLLIASVNKLRQQVMVGSVPCVHVLDAAVLFFHD